MSTQETNGAEGGPAVPGHHGLSRDVSAQIERAVAGLRFGSVEIVLHEGRVVQIERKEKVRLDRPVTT